MNEKTIKRLQELPRVLIENGNYILQILQEEYEKLQDKEQKDERLKDKIDYMEEYIKTVENARNDLERELEQKEQECERLKWYLKEIRDDELKTLDIELDEYETHCVDTEYSNIINLVEEALEERSPEDCRYKKDK